MPTTRVLLPASPGIVPVYPGQASRTRVRLPENTSYAKGTILSERMGSPGLFVAYRPGDVAKLILEFDCVTDATGSVTQGSLVAGSDCADLAVATASAFFAGTFPTRELVGLDANSLWQLGALIQGTMTDGLLRVG